MTNKQKRAIGYAMRERSKKRREAFIIEREGSLDGFRQSKYKSMLYYTSSDIFHGSTVKAYNDIITTSLILNEVSTI